MSQQALVCSIQRLWPNFSALLFDLFIRRTGAVQRAGKSLRRSGSGRPPASTEQISVLFDPAFVSAAAGAVADWFRVHWYLAESARKARPRV